MFPIVTFVKRTDPKWQRSTSCAVPAVGDIVTMIDNDNESNREAFTVTVVNRLFIDIDFKEDDGRGGLLQEEIRVGLEPFTN